MTDTKISLKTAGQNAVETRGLKSELKQRYGHFSLRRVKRAERKEQQLQFQRQLVAARTKGEPTRTIQPRQKDYNMGR